MWRQSSIQLRIALVITVIGLGIDPSVRAQDQADPEDDAPAPHARLRDSNITDAQFNQMFFGPFGSSESATVQFEFQLKQKLKDLERWYGLTPAQTKKLEIAGKGDIHRFLTSVREKKKQLERLPGKPGERTILIRELHKMQQSALKEFPFNKDSLLEKTLVNTVSPDQQSRYAKEFYRSRVEWTFSQSRLRLQLSEDAFRRLVSLVVEQTPALKQYGPFDAYAVMVQMSKLPRDQFEPFLNRSELRMLRIRFLEVSSIESMLVRRGYLDEQSPKPDHPNLEGRQHPAPNAAGPQPVQGLNIPDCGLQITESHLGICNLPPGILQDALRALASYGVRFEESDLGRFESGIRSRVESTALLMTKASSKVKPLGTHQPVHGFGII